MYRLLLLGFLSAFWANILIGNDRIEYAEKYASVAVSEMHRTGIPASIKLAQGILESNAGKSVLALKAKNHFGMKCGNHWGGKTFYREDDDRDRRGKLIKSCFRHFSSSEESYIAHSEFLTDPRKEHRYGPLFKLRSDDFKGWAKGLKKSGYATNPKYAHLLIKIIEDYQLYRYDQLPNSSFEEPMVVSNENVQPQVVIQTDKPNTKSPQIPNAQNREVQSSAQIVKYQNDVKYVQALAGDTPEKIAKKFKISVHQLLRYNEGLKKRSEQISGSNRVYIQAKKRKYKGRQKYHVIKPDETLLEISNAYGVCVSGLRKRNKLNVGDDPAAGQKLYLRGKNPKTIKVRTKYLHVPTERRKSKIVKKEPAVVQKSPKTVPEMVTRHVVQKKETLYGISRAYGISVEKLKKINNLGENTIHPGQVLIIK